MKSTPSEEKVRETINTYFEGLHFADTYKLESVFSQDCVLKAPGLRRDLKQWLDLVTTRPVPAQQGDAFAYRILDLEIAGQQAMVKACCPLLGQRFVDYLGLLYENGRWLIVNKMYAQNTSGEEHGSH